MTRTASCASITDLYRDLQPQLVRILASNLQPPDWVIDDACQTAWRSLLEHRATVAPGGELGWLSTTATRAALELLRRQRMLVCDEQPETPAGSVVHQLPQPEPDQQLELRQRLAEVRRLPVREQRVLMLHGFGYEYEEIAAATGQSWRTVARQLTRARRRLLRLADE